jgi:deoxyribose-phosphate aldolase
VTLDLNHPEAVASLIDHTLLKPEVARGDIVQLCEEARAFGFRSVCVNPYWLPVVSDILAGGAVNLCTVIGFPLGANDRRTKIAEAELALSQGAQELDMVQNIGALRSGDFGAVRDEIAAIADVAHRRGAIVKVILETCLLDDREKAMACTLAAEARADFVKTSTGFSTHGATVEDVKLMRQTVGPSMGVKASGGIRTLEALKQMVGAGANRIGTSSGVKMMGELEQAHGGDKLRRESA